jgi:hypothetical protein
METGLGLVESIPGGAGGIGKASSKLEVRSSNKVETGKMI